MKCCFTLHLVKNSLLDLFLQISFPRSLGMRSFNNQNRNFGAFVCLSTYFILKIKKIKNSILIVISGYLAMDNTALAEQHAY